MRQDRPVSGAGSGRISPTPSPSGLRRVIGASVVGTSLEWYDFFLYTTAAALVFNELFFPTFDPLAGTLAAFATGAVGFVARPLGGIVFGHYGDRVGRKGVLVTTLLVMGVSTVLIGLLPTYASIGAWAPVLLVLLRFVQGIGLGGEWGGAVLMALEHGRTGRRGLYASWPQVGVPAGNLLASGVLALFSGLLSNEAFTSWGWRVPFLLSGVLVLVGLYVRLRVEESPLFRSVAETNTRARTPIVDVFRVYRRAVAVAVAARFGTDVAFYTFSLFIVTYVTQQLGLPRGLALGAVLVGSTLQLALIPLAGAVSDRLGRRPVYLAGIVGGAVWALVFFPLLDTRSTGLVVVAATVGLAFHALMYGPQAAFLAELFGTRVRYSGASLGYQLAGVAGGALAPIISTAMLGYFGSAFPVAIYVVASLGVSLVAVLLAAETSAVDLEEARPEERGIVERPEAFATSADPAAP